MKFLRIEDLYGNTRQFNAAQLISAAKNDRDNFTGGFLSYLDTLDHESDFAKIAEMCAPSCGGNWCEAVILDL